MNVFSTTESDLAVRIRRMGTRSRIMAAVLLCAMAAVTLPSSGIAAKDDGVDWNAVRTTAPEDWSQELKDQIAAAGYDVEAIAARMRQSQTAATGDETAADLEAIGQRIRAAVESGELTPEEGRKKMEAARQAAGEGDDDKRHADRVWRAAMATDPDDWSDELKAAILALKPDSTIEEIAEGIRQRRQAARVWAAAMATDPDDWSDRLKEAILALKPDSTIEEIAEGIRQRQQAAGADLDALGRRIRAAVENGDLTPEEGRAKWEAAQQAAGAKDDDRLRELQRGVIARAMAADPDEWSDELKAAVVRAGWDLDEFTEGIRRRQAGGGEAIDLPQSEADLNTSVEESSWGQVKDEVNESE